MANEKKSAPDTAGKADTSTDSKPKKTTAERDAARRRKEEQARRSRRRNRQWIGVGLAVLILVGAISIVRGAYGLVQQWMDNTPEREQYEQRLTTMVWFDVLPFETVDQLEPNTIKQTAIWGVWDEFRSRGEELEKDELGAVIVPVQEVNRYIAELFSPVVLQSLPPHETFTDITQDLTYIYDAERNTYTIPPTGVQPFYLPTVVDIQNEGSGVKRVTVGYVSTRNAEDTIITQPDFEHPEKYMDFIFQRDGGEYYLVALQRNTTITPSTNSSAGQTPQSVLTEDSSIPVPASPATESNTVEEPPSSSTADEEEPDDSGSGDDSDESDDSSS